MSNSRLLEVTGLRTYYFTSDGVVKAVDGVDIAVHPGRTLALVGESGCGKSVTSLSILRLIGAPGKVVEGKILFRGQDLLKLAEEEMCEIRGHEISMIFQQPTSCLNPVFTAGAQVAEAVMVHQKVGAREARARAVEMFRLVGIASPDRVADDYPHELSGGMCQRVMIAMALSCNPQLLIADEPTTALDVTIQAQILELMKDLKRRINTAIILITHDLGVVAEMADEVAVMYAGKIVERADALPVFLRPLHPYTQGLLRAIPVLGNKGERLAVIPGTVPNPVNLPPGCAFAPRCPHRMEICTQEEPPLLPVETGHLASCWLY